MTTADRQAEQIKIEALQQAIKDLAEDGWKISVTNDQVEITRPVSVMYLPDDVVQTRWVWSYCVAIG